MFRLILLLTFSIATALSAGLSVENEKDRKIFEESYKVATELLSKNGKDKAGNELIKFAAWLNPESPEVKAIRANLVFGEAITSSGPGDAGLLARMLMARQKEFDSMSKRALYTLVANSVDPGNVDATVQLKEFKDQGHELSLKKVMDESEKPKLVDLEAIAQQKKAEAMKIEQENKQLEQISNNSASQNVMKAAEIEKMLDLMKFKMFSYSEATVLDAVNRLTHKMFWRGVQFTIAGKRISYTETKVAPNGAMFYFGPLYQPEKEEFNLKDKTIREILEHMGMNVDLIFKVSDGIVALSDSEVPEFSDIPEEGLAANDLQRVMKDFRIADLQKYRGKVFKMNGIVTGLGRGMDSRVVYFAMDGGLIQLYASRESLEQDVYKRMDHEIEVWKKNGGVKKYRDAVNEAKKTGAEIDRKVIANPKLYVTFKAKCKGMDKGRLIFEDPEFIYIDGTEEFLLKQK